MFTDEIRWIKLKDTCAIPYREVLLEPPATLPWTNIVGLMRINAVDGDFGDYKKPR